MHALLTVMKLKASQLAEKEVSAFLTMARAQPSKAKPLLKISDSSGTHELQLAAHGQHRDKSMCTPRTLLNPKP